MYIKSKKTSILKHFGFKETFSFVERHLLSSCRHFWPHKIQLDSRISIYVEEKNRNVTNLYLLQKIPHDPKYENFSSLFFKLVLFAFSIVCSFVPLACDR